MDSTTRRTLLIAATAFVWAAALAASVGRFKLAAKPPVTIALTTKPAVIRVMVNSERQFEGAYVETPQKLSIPPGKHKLKILRDGYIAHVVTVEGDSGEVYRMEDVVLQRSPSAEFSVVELTTAAGDASVHVDIDDGLVRGETPLTSEDLVADAAHLLTVYPKWPDKDGRYRCKFLPAATKDGHEPYRIRIKAKGGKVKVTGCERIKPRK